MNLYNHHHQLTYDNSNIYYFDPKNLLDGFLTEKWLSKNICDSKTAQDKLETYLPNQW